MIKKLVKNFLIFSKILNADQIYLIRGLQTTKCRPADQTDFLWRPKPRPNPKQKFSRPNDPFRDQIGKKRPNLATLVVFFVDLKFHLKNIIMKNKFSDYASKNVQKVVWSIKKVIFPNKMSYIWLAIKLATFYLCDFLVAPKVATFSKFCGYSSQMPSGRPGSVSSYLAIQQVSK